MSNASLTSLQKHPNYHLSGGDLYLLVENYMFRVHKYFFERESSYFRDRLTVPASPGELPKGTSESNAFVVHDVRATEFERLLWVFYNPKYSLYDTSVEDWCIILRLAHEWKFAEVKSLSIREIEKLHMPDLDRIVLYHDNDVDRNLLVNNYAALCSREQPISIHEGMRLGLETSLMIARAREYARSKPASNGSRSPVSAELQDEEMRSLVLDLFALNPDGLLFPPSAHPTPTKSISSDDHFYTNGTNGTNGSNGTKASTNGFINGIHSNGIQTPRRGSSPTPSGHRTPSPSPSPSFSPSENPFSPSYGRGGRGHQRNGSRGSGRSGFY